MKPKSPVIPGEKLDEIIYGKNQKEYIPLPALVVDDGLIVTRWKASLRDRIRVFFTGNVYLWIRTFNEKLQPVSVSSRKPNLIRVFSYSTKIKGWFRWAFNLNPQFGWMKTPGGWLCWDFENSLAESPRIYWSRDMTLSPESGLRIILKAKKKPYDNTR